MRFTFQRPQSTNPLIELSEEEIENRKAAYEQWRKGSKVIHNKRIIPKKVLRTACQCNSMTKTTDQRCKNMTTDPSGMCHHHVNK
jgi:hypothetical protein